MLGCNDTEVPINARSPVSAKCPFDTTRIYVSSDFSHSLSTLKITWDTSTHSPCDLLSSEEIFKSILCGLLPAPGHSPGLVDPMYCPVRIWGWPVCVVLCYWAGSQRTRTLYEEIHQKAGLWVCVWMDESGHIDPRLKFNFALICFTSCHVSVSNEAKGETTKPHIQFSSSLKKQLTSLHTTSAWLYHTQTLMPDSTERTSGSLGHLDWKGVAPPALTILNCCWI